MVPSLVDILHAHDSPGRDEGRGQGSQRDGGTGVALEEHTTHSGGVDTGDRGGQHGAVLGVVEILNNSRGDGHRHRVLDAVAVRVTEDELELTGAVAKLTVGAGVGHLAVPWGCEGTGGDLGPHN